MRFMMMNEDSFSNSDEDDDGYDINHDDENDYWVFEHC